MKKSRFRVKKSKQQMVVSQPTTSSTQTVNINLSKENASLFKRWITWEKIVGLATILTAVITIYMLWPKPEIVRIKDNLNKNIQITKMNVHPEEYANLRNAHEDVKLVCAFQYTLLRFVYDWESFENTPPLDEYESESKEEKFSIFLSKIKTRRQSLISFLLLLNYMDRILKYGIENNIAYYIPNKARWVTIKNSAHKWYAVNNNKNDKTIRRILYMIMNINNHISKKVVMEAIEPYEESNEKNVYYKFFDDALSYIIELNAQYCLQINSYRLNK